jgi:hypothetical protein
MSGWKIRKNDWYILDPREVEDGGEGVLRRETALRRAETWMAGLHELPLIEKRRERADAYTYAYGRDEGGARTEFQVVRGSWLQGLAMIRREYNVREKYPYAWTGGAYRTDQFINREPLLRDPYFVRRELARAQLAVLGLAETEPEGQ